MKVTSPNQLKEGMYLRVEYATQPRHTRRKTKRYEYVIETRVNEYGEAFYTSKYIDLEDMFLSDQTGEEGSKFYPEENNYIINNHEEKKLAMRYLDLLDKEVA